MKPTTLWYLIIVTVWLVIFRNFGVNIFHDWLQINIKYFSNRPRSVPSFLYINLSVCNSSPSFRRLKPLCCHLVFISLCLSTVILEIFQYMVDKILDWFVSVVQCCIDADSIRPVLSQFGHHQPSTVPVPASSELVPFRRHQPTCHWNGFASPWVHDCKNNTKEIITVNKEIQLN